MKHLIIFIIQIILLHFFSTAQKNQVCLVKYKVQNANNKIENYWFFKDKYLVTINAVNETINPETYKKNVTPKADSLYNISKIDDFINTSREIVKTKSSLVKLKYYNSTKLQMAYYHDLNQKNYKIIDTLEEMQNWKITNETCRVLGYLCTKAIINHKQQNYMAWFTTQLPFKAGPEGFDGLPGLILLVKKADGSLAFEAIEVQVPAKETVPQFNYDGEVISKQTYKALLKARNNKIVYGLESLMEKFKGQGLNIKYQKTVVQ